MMSPHPVFAVVLVLVAFSNVECRTKTDCGVVDEGAWEDGELQESPWKVTVEITYSEDYLTTCLGTILTPLHILTAANCFDHPNKSIYDSHVVVKVAGPNLVLNTVNNIKDYRHEIVEHKIACMGINPQYNAITRDNDLAILTLENGIDLTKKYKAVCLPEHSDLEKLELEENIMFTEPSVPRVDNDECNDEYFNGLTDTMICAGTESQMNCYPPPFIGRSLSWTHPNNLITIVGVASIESLGCRTPSVYAKLIHHLDWINQQIANETNNCAQLILGKLDSTAKVAKKAWRGISKSVQSLKKALKPLSSTPSKENSAQKVFGKLDSKAKVAQNACHGLNKLVQSLEEALTSSYN